MDLYIKSITGQVEMLPGFEVKRNNRVNGEKIIEVSGSKFESNEHAYPLVQNENIFIYGDDEYIIKEFRERTIGDSVKVECKAIHRIFEDLNNNRIYDTTSGTFSIGPLMNFALEGSGYTFSIDPEGIVASITVENFGDDNSTSLIKKLIERFGIEFDVVGTHMYIGKQIGRITDHQVRHKLNINNPSREINTNGFATYIRGYGKRNEDGTYAAYAEYTSPLAEIYGIKHAPPIRDERYTDNNSLLEFIKNSLNDSLEVSIKLTYVELMEMGIQDIQRGDYVWCIIDPFNIDLRIRVIEVEDYSNTFRSPVYTLGTITKKASDIMAGFNTTKAAFERVVDIQTNTVKQSALTTTTNYVVDAIERTFSQVDYNDDVSAGDPANFMRRVGIRKGGIYRTTDGTYRLFVITPDGLDLSQVFGVLDPEHVSIGPETTFAEGYDPTKIIIPSYSLATATKDGLLSMADFSKLASIELDEAGNVVIDLTEVNGKISSLEQQILDIETRLADSEIKIADFETRIAALETGGA